MSESRLLEMKVFLTLVLTCVCFKPGTQLETNGSAEITQDLVTDDDPLTDPPPSVYMDPQVRGFNSTNLTSGPVIVADKRTLFFTDFRYFGPENMELQFLVGEDDSPYQNDSEKHRFYSGYYTNRSANFYLELPAELDLSKVKYLQVVTKDGSLDYILLEKINAAALKEFNASNKEDSVYRFPKCCKADEYYNEFMSCDKAKKPLQLSVNIFESNQTGLDPDVFLDNQTRQIPYYKSPSCPSGQTLIEVSELNGLIYNQTLIVQGLGIYNHGEFCVDGISDENGTVQRMVLVCMEIAQPSTEPNFYLPALIISTVCFALSAAAYGMILKREDIHKRCFIMFSSAMCLAFVCLIVMQVQSDKVTCSIFGFICLFTVSLSFLWLLILCLELLYQVIRPIEKKRYNGRWYWYCGISLGLSLLIFFISLLTGDRWTPDVPNCFIMPYGDTDHICDFKTSFPRAFITYAPIIVSILGSSASLIALQPCINRNENDMNISSHYDWTNHAISYKFLSRTYIMIIIVACFWLLGLFFYESQLSSGVTRLALDVIKASLGIVTFVGFVGNKYTREEISTKWCKKPVTEKDLGLNGYPTPTPSPGTPPEEFPLMQRNNTDLTTFRDRRSGPNG